MDISANERRQAFSVWLRTGRLPAVKTADGVELKFNPWHDWQTGRFTFAGTGRYSSDGWMGGDFTGGGGGSFGGGGATGTWERPEKRLKAQAPRRAEQLSRRAGSPKSLRPPGQWQRPTPLLFS